MQMDGVLTTLLSLLLQTKPAASATIISPWGVSQALAMLLKGAAQGSPSQSSLLNVVLRKSQGTSSLDALLTGLQAIMNTLASPDDSSTAANQAITFTTANSVWVNPQYTLLPGYIASLQHYFGADARALTTANEVNEWVSQATAGKITSIIDSGMAARAVLILINAIYFKGFWEAPFPKENTQKLPFHRIDGSGAMDVPMMYLKYERGTAVQGTTFDAPFPGVDTNQCVAVKLAYKGGDYAAVVAMPAELKPAEAHYVQALAACRSHLMTTLAPSAGQPGLKWTTVGEAGPSAAKIYLPRFKVEYSASLRTALVGLGLGPIFEAGDFTNVVQQRDLMVSDVVHKVFVQVDEEGTEAAAATAVVMMRMAFRDPASELFVKFDKPFVFSVVHNATGLLLFAGEIREPEVWKGS